MSLRRFLGRGNERDGADEDVRYEDVLDDPDPAPSPPEEQPQEDEPEAGSEAEDETDDEDDEDDEADEDDDEDDDEGEETEPQRIRLAFAEWGARERQLLDNELAANGLHYVWEAGDLIVDRSDEEAVEGLVELIQWRISLDLAPDIEPVIYDIGDWPPGLDERFAEELVDARIPHARGFREFTVGIDDEERVDEIVERISRDWEAGQDDLEDDDGLDAQQVLSDLFLSTDRLTHAPKSKSDSSAFEGAAATAAAMEAPFGFEPSDWDALLEDVKALGDLLADEDSYEDDIMDAATNLRTRLRALV